MAKSPPLKRRRWRGVPLGGRLMRRCKFALAGPGYKATTRQIASWCWPDGNPTRWQLHSQAKALRRIRAKRIRRIGNQWLWRLPSTD